MSIQARIAVVQSPFTFFTADSQRTDLLNPSMTDSNLIALIAYLLDRGHILEFTAIRSDHHDDGPHGHNPGGLAFDCWPLNSAVAGDWLDGGGALFQHFLEDVGKFPGLYQLGLAGSADTAVNREVCGLPQDFNADPCCFSDSGGDHVHCGVHPA